MTQDEIISMAREAGYSLYDLTETHGIKTVETDEADEWTQLERFATLVAAAEREACAAHYLGIMRQAVELEREACAKECDRLAEEFAALAQTADVDEAGRHGYSHAESAAVGCASALRARGQA